VHGKRSLRYNIVSYCAGWTVQVIRGNGWNKRRCYQPRHIMRKHWRGQMPRESSRAQRHPDMVGPAWKRPLGRAYAPGGPGLTSMWCGNMMEPESSKGEPGIAVGTRFAQILRSRTTISVPLKVHHGRGHGERTYEEMIHVQELFTRSSSSEWTPCLARRMQSMKLH
jgi:hypothetical protein